MIRLPFCLFANKPPPYVRKQPNPMPVPVSLLLIFTWNRSTRENTFYCNQDAEGWRDGRCVLFGAISRQSRQGARGKVRVSVERHSRKDGWQSRQGARGKVRVSVERHSRKDGWQSRQGARGKVPVSVESQAGGGSEEALSHTPSRGGMVLFLSKTWQGMLWDAVQKAGIWGRVSLRKRLSPWLHASHDAAVLCHEERH